MIRATCNVKHRYQFDCNIKLRILSREDFLRRALKTRDIYESNLISNANHGWDHKSTGDNLNDLDIQAQNVYIDEEHLEQLMTFWRHI